MDMKYCFSDGVWTRYSGIDLVALMINHIAFVLNSISFKPPVVNISPCEASARGFYSADEVEESEQK